MNVLSVQRNDTGTDLFLNVGVGAHENLSFFPFLMKEKRESDGVTKNKHCIFVCLLGVVMEAADGRGRLRFSND